MKNLTLILLLLVSTIISQAQIINFPDPNFKNALMNTKCVDTDGNGSGDVDADTNNDGEIDISEAVVIQNLYVSLKQISNLSGIENFSNLRELKCDQNILVELDVSSLKELVKLNCYGNMLTSLNVVGCLKLKNLNCSSNKLEFLDVHDLFSLEYCTCYINNLSSINLSGCKNIVELRTWNNKLTTLNISDLISLRQLYSELNPLESIDLRGLKKLSHVLCNNTKLKTLDLSDQKSLISLDCKNCNELESIFVKTGRENEIPFVTLDSCFNLTYICTDEISIDKFKSSIPNANFTEINSFCSFTPGLDFYILQGINSFDFNNNGCDLNYIKWPNTKYSITDDKGKIGLKISDDSGSFNFALLTGTYKVKPILDGPDYFEVNPPSFTVTFPSSSDTITQDFCISSKGIYRKTDITVLPLSPPARPGFDAAYKIIWENKGNQIESGTLNFTYNEALLDYIKASQNPDIIADGILKWNFTNLLPFEKREITVTLKVNKPTDNPAVNTGDKLYLTASILDNIFTLENTVVGSYDPNDKTCLQGDRVHPDQIGKYVDFLIRFENTGNYAAENIVVKDIIDAKRFEVSSLQITDASHRAYARIDGNKVEFIFEHIQLPFDDENNDGYIAFKIKTLPTLSVGDSLKNLADIYFDYNFPIRTNETKSLLAFPVFTNDFTYDLKIYPNPAKDILYLNTKDSWTKADIYDIDGRIIRSLPLDGSSIYVGGLESGTYFMRVKNGEKVRLVKFVKF